MTPSPGRSLVVFHIGGVGGPQRSLGGALTLLRERGTVEFMVPEAGPTVQDFSAFGPVTVAPYQALVYANGLRSAPRTARALVHDVRLFRRELRRRRPDIVIAITTVLPALLVAARLERVPAVVYAAEIYGQDWKRARGRRAFGVALAYATAWLSKGIVCCSDAVARQFPRSPRRRVAVAYPPIGREYAGGSRARGRERLGLAAEDICVGVVGSLSRGRGQDVAIRAVAALRERYPSLRLLVVGTPHPREVDVAFARELRDLARDLGVDQAVTFAGTDVVGSGADAMADVYAAVDLVVNPARVAESFGRVAPEALVAGRPVVATRVGAVSEVLRDGVDAVLVPPDDPGALANAVAKVLDDPALAGRLVESGGLRALELCSLEQDLAAWRRVLESASVGAR